MRHIFRSFPRKLFSVLLLVLFGIYMRTFLPPILQTADFIHLAKIAIFYQNFPLYEPDTISDTMTSLPVVVDVESVKRYAKRSSQLMNIPASVPPEFRSPMTLKNKTDLLVTLETFLKICKRNNFTVFPIGGSLLGVYRHQGLIPWDDDVDIVMNASDWRRIRHVFSKVPGFELHAFSHNQWKFNMVDLPSIPDKTFKWPNIDIFFFTEDEDYIWALTNGIKDELFAKKSDFFPLKYHPFEYLQMPMPCNWEDLTLKQYDANMCVSRDYDHKESSSISTKSKHCVIFHRIYPFVSRTKMVDKTLEVLKIGESIIRSSSVDNQCGLR